MKWASDYWIDWSAWLWRLHVRLSWRDASGLMGRFGGGWNYKLGVQVGVTTVIVSLILFSVSLTWPSSDGKARYLERRRKRLEKAEAA